MGITLQILVFLAVVLFIAVVVYLFAIYFDSSRVDRMTNRIRRFLRLD